MGAGGNGEALAINGRTGPSTELSEQSIESDSALDTRIETMLLDLVALAIGAKRDMAFLAQERGLRAARVPAIRADVRENIGAQDVSVEAVAARHGMTPRYLHMLFEGEEKTFNAFVASERLMAAHRRLTDPRRKPQRISDLAFSLGFADISTFNRQFKREYGVTPSNLRAAAVVGD